MAKFPTLNDQEPILPNIKINDESSGYEAFANTLGNIAKTSSETYQKIEKDKSQAMLMQSAADSQTIKTDAQINMIQHPDMAGKILSSAQERLNIINKTAFVDAKDRRSLEYINSQDANQLRIKAASITAKEQQIIAQNEIFSGLKNNYQQIDNALERGDFKTVNILEQSLNDTLLNATKSNFLSPSQLDKIIKTNQALYKRTSLMQDMVKDPTKHTAHNYHQIKGSPFSEQDNIDYPSNEHTAHITREYNDDRSMQGQYAALYNDKALNFNILSKAKNHEWDKFYQEWSGKNYVEALISSNTPVDQIQAEMNQLESSPAYALNYRDTGKLNYWKNLVRRMQTTEGAQEIIDSSTEGRKINDEYNMRLTIANNTLSKSKDKSEIDKANNEIRENFNDRIGKRIDLYRGMKWIPDNVSPVDQPVINKVQNSFEKNAPVLPALQTMSYLNREYAPYIANALKSHHQGIAYYLAAQVSDRGFKADLIAANQDTASSPNQDKDEKGNTKENSILVTSSANRSDDNSLWLDLINSSDEMKNVFSYISAQPKSAMAQSGLKKSAVNYIRYMAERSGDLELNNKDEYINNFVKNTVSGFNIYKNDRALINLNDIEVTRKQDADHLVNYALTKAYKNLHSGQSESDFLASIDLNPLMLVSTTDKRLVVVDRYGRAAVTKDGKEAFDEPYTSDMLSAAQVSAKENSDYLFNYGGISTTEKFVNNITESYKDKEGNLQLPYTPQDIMIKRLSISEKAKQERRNAQDLLNKKDKK